MNELARTTCDLVAERVALGEPLADLREHADACARCRAVIALPARLGGTHAAVDPGLGFAARMTAGAQHRIVVRRKRRLAGGAAAVAAACAACVLVFAHAGGDSAVAIAPPSPTHATPEDPPALQDIWSQRDPSDPSRAQRHADPDVRALVHLADIDRDLRGTARWSRIDKPLRPYRALVQGVPGVEGVKP